jgi:hypothetical protein
MDVLSTLDDARATFFRCPKRKEKERKREREREKKKIARLLTDRVRTSLAAALFLATVLSAGAALSLDLTCDRKKHGS